MTTADDRLAEIQQRADAATPGPWTLDYEQDDREYSTTPPWPYALRLPEHTVSYREYPCDPAAPLDNYKHSVSELCDLTDATAEFIVNAREDIPWLLAEVVLLRGKLTAATELAERAIQRRPERSEEWREFTAIHVALGGPDPRCGDVLDSRRCALLRGHDDEWHDDGGVAWPVDLTESSR